MDVFDKPRIGGVYSGSLLPAMPTAFRPNWGNPLLAKLAYLFVPHPNGQFYWDVVRGRRAVFSGANANNITPVQTKFGLAYVFGSTAGGQSAYAALNDPTLEPPVNGLTIASGAYNQTTISNVTMEFASVHDTAFNNALTVFVANNSGTPRMMVNCTNQSTNTSVTANGGAGTTMIVAGQYMTYAASYNGTTVLADYTTTGLGHNVGSAAKTGWPTGILQATISDASVSNFNSGRAMTWMAIWFRALSAAELQTVTSFIGGLPTGFLRRG